MKNKKDMISYNRRKKRIENILLPELKNLYELEQFVIHDSRNDEYDILVPGDLLDRYWRLAFRTYKLLVKQEKLLEQMNKDPDWDWFEGVTSVMPSNFYKAMYDSIYTNPLEMIGI